MAPLASPWHRFAARLGVDVGVERCRFHLDRQNTRCSGRRDSFGGFAVARIGGPRRAALDRLAHVRQGGPIVATRAGSASA